MGWYFGKHMGRCVSEYTSPEMRVIDFNRKFVRYINGETAISIYDRLFKNGNWDNGGCWILAQAIQRWLGHGNLYALVAGDGAVEHVVVKTNDHYLDGQGARHKDDFLAWAKNYMTAPRLVPFDNEMQRKARGAHIPSGDDDTVTKLAALISTRFGSPGRWGL